MVDANWNKLGGTSRGSNGSESLIGSNPVLTAKKKDMYNEEKTIIEAPVVTVDDFYNEEKTLVIHSHINMKGKMILNKEEASLLLIELYKFIKS